MGESILLESMSAYVYPEENDFRLKYRIKDKGKIALSKKMATRNIAKAIKASPTINDSALYEEIEETEFTAKEFNYHQVPCHQRFTRKYLLMWLIYK